MRASIQNRDGLPTLLALDSYPKRIANRSSGNRLCFTARSASSQPNTIMSIENPEQKIPTVSGVYQIRCKSNGKIYIGSAVNLRQRWDGHRRALRKQRHHNVHLQAAWNRYGEAS